MRCSPPRRMRILSPPCAPMIAFCFPDFMSSLYFIPGSNGSRPPPSSRGPKPCLATARQRAVRPSTHGGGPSPEPLNNAGIAGGRLPLLPFLAIANGGSVKAADTKRYYLFTDTLATEQE